jgi:RNA polymerase sigma-70 factor (ECF subfamily)
MNSMSGTDGHKLEPEKWLERYGDFLYNYALVRVNDPARASDLVQETFLAGLKARDAFQGKAAERTWLVSILKRKIIDVYRKQYTRKEISPVESEEGFFDPEYYKAGEPFRGHWQKERAPHSHSLLPEGEMEEAELASIIQMCIEHLPPRLSAVFIMKMVDEEESEKVCKELGITATNLWVMLHRARLRMRECLETNWLSDK